jgi:hypothetical protein
MLKYLVLCFSFPAKRGGKPEDKENFISLIKVLFNIQHFFSAGNLRHSFGNQINNFIEKRIENILVPFFKTH